MLFGTQIMLSIIIGQGLTSSQAHSQGLNILNGQSLIIIIHLWPCDKPVFWREGMAGAPVS